MYIDRNAMEEILSMYNITCQGVLHLGAHYCEEIDVYEHHLKLGWDKMIWIDPMSEHIEYSKNMGIPNLYQEVIGDTDDKEVVFNVANNGESSSILELKDHAVHYPHIHYTDKRTMKTITIDTFMKKYNLDAFKYDFWNLDIQGAELMALKGGCHSLKHAKVVYLEVNAVELYKGCPLVKDIDNFMKLHGFMRIFNSIKHSDKFGDAMYIRNDIIEQNIEAITKSIVTIKREFHLFSERIVSEPIKRANNNPIL